jgi:hypothetical protein
MLKDIELAKSVNVIKGPSNEGMNDKVRYIYSEMIEPTMKKINEFVDINPSFFKLKIVKITRKLIKPTIMTRVYNVTVRGVSNQLISNFEKFYLNNKNKNIEPIKNDSSLTNDISTVESIENEIMNDLNEYYGIENVDNNIIEPQVNYFENKNVIYKVPSIIENENLILTGEEVYQLAKNMHMALFQYYPALEKLFEYFISVCLAFTKLDLPNL